MSSTALVTTTVHVPEALYGYALDARRHGRAVKIYVAGDRKTHAGAAECCASVSRCTGIECEYMSPDAQDLFLSPWPELREHLPWNCVQRRNVAVLKAACDGADVVVTIDDDNFVADEDYFAYCDTLGSGVASPPPQTLPAYGRPGEWFNVCRFLATANNYQFVPRGYGMAARSLLGDGAKPMEGTPLTLPVAVLAGLWLGDPDIDASTRLAHPVEVTGYRLDHNFFLAPGARSPFNSQNTMLARDVLPAFFLSPHVGRYDDIFASLLVKRIADHLGWGVSFGRPLVRQRRHAHDLLRDFDLERFGMRHVDALADDLATVALSSESWAACVLQVCEELGQARGSRATSGGEDGENAARWAAFFSGYRIWAELPVWH